MSLLLRKNSEISMAWDAKGCEMQPITDHLGFVVKNHCCNNERVYVQNNTLKKLLTKL